MITVKNVLIFAIVATPILIVVLLIKHDYDAAGATTIASMLGLLWPIKKNGKLKILEDK
jgi:hypothetical protein